MAVEADAFQRFPRWMWRNRDVLAAVPQQFDAVVHFDETEAVEPLDLSPGWEPAGELPETYPSGV